MTTGMIAESPNPARISEITLHLSRNPARLTQIIDRLCAWENVKEFQELIRTYLPDLLDEISRETRLDDQVIRFGREFGERYFPINDLEDLLDTDESLCTLIQHGIQIIPYGTDLEELHQIWDQESPGRAILITMAQAPAQYLRYFEGDGNRVAWLESALRRISQETLRRIPPGGIPQEVIEDTTRGTPLEAIQEIIQWAYRNTSNIFLYMNYDEEYYDLIPPWNPETVKWLQEEWKEAQEILDRMHRLEKWLEADLENRFTLILDFILERAELLPPRTKEKE